jgi:1,4-dihydroxy-2-naphthoyl-CoA hydrolase
MSRPEPAEVAAAIGERIQGSFPGDLGIEPLEASEAGARGRLVVDSRHLHPGGYVHGGVWVGFADSVAAWGTLMNLPPGHDFTTVELKLSLFAAAGEGDELIAEAEPLHVGRSTHVWEVRVRKGDRLVAVFGCTQMVLPPPDEPTADAPAAT